jgi:hypothetical protein
MLRRREPALDNVLKFFRRNARVCHQDQFNEAFFARCGNVFHIASQQGRERFLIFPFWMLGSHLFHTVDRKGQLHVHGLLGPERTVVVEDGDAIGRWYVIDAAFRGDLFDEAENRVLGCSFIP